MVFVPDVQDECLQLRQRRGGQPSLRTCELSTIQLSERKVLDSRPVRAESLQRLFNHDRVPEAELDEQPLGALQTQLEPQRVPPDRDLLPELGRTADEVAPVRADGHELGPVREPCREAWARLAIGRSEDLEQHFVRDADHWGGRPLREVVRRGLPSNR